MFPCLICKKIIPKNSVVYMFQDNSFCSEKCRNILIKHINNKKN